MKKNLFWIVAVLLGIGTGFLIWCQRPGLGVEQVLPSHPIVFARLDHVAEHVDQLVRSDFAKNVTAINLPEVLDRNNFSKKDVRDFERWQTDIVKLWKNPLMKRFLGKEAAVAVYRNDDSYKVFIVLRLTLSTRIAEFIGQLSHHWTDEVTLTQQPYQGRVINQLSFKDQDLGLSYVRIRDLLIIAPESLGHLQEVVDVYQHKDASLEEDPSFNFVRKNAYPSSEGLVFVNVNSIVDIWQGDVDTPLSTLGHQSGAFPVYGLSYVPATVNKYKISKYKMLVGLNEKYLPSAMRQVFTCPALANDTLKFVPVDAIAYNWGGCYDFAQSWGLARQKLEEYPDLSDEVLHFKHRLERHFHVNIKKDLLPVLGREIGGYLTDLDMQGTYPFPRLLIFVKIKNVPAANRLLARFTENPNLAFESEEYKNVNIRYVTLPFGGNIDPGYGFLDDYLLIASSRQLLKRTIDAYHNSLRSIVSDDVVEQFSLSGDQKFNSVTLMKTGELSRRAQDFLGWMDRYLSGQVTMAAAYQQDGENKMEELDQAIADKSAELILAQNKLYQLKKAPIQDAVLEDPDLVNGAIANLSREEDAIRDDKASYIEQKADLSRVLDNYNLGAQSDKLTMYNMDNIVSPVLKGLESIDAQAVTVRYGDKMLETEFLVK